MDQPHPYQGHAFALQASAGLALACAYSSSEEYEAEVIQMRRAAGAYRSQNHWPMFTIIGLTVAGAVAVIGYLASQFAG